MSEREPNTSYNFLHDPEYVFPGSPAVRLLPQRHMDVLSLRAGGFQDREIANILGYTSDETINAILHNQETGILVTLNARNPLDAILMCLEQSALPKDAVIPPGYDMTVMDRLTPTEYEILNAGLSIRDSRTEAITKELGLNYYTKRVQITEIRRKLNTRNTLQALSYYAVYTMARQSLQEVLATEEHFDPGNLFPGTPEMQLLSQLQLNILFLKASGHTNAKVAEIIGNVNEGFVKRSLWDKPHGILATVDAQNPFAAVLTCLEQGALPKNAIMPKGYDMKRMRRLNPKEYELLNTGLTIRDSSTGHIAEELQENYKGTCQHFEKIREKLDVRNNMQALSYYAVHTMNQQFMQEEIARPRLHSPRPETPIEIANAVKLGLSTGAMLVVSPLQQEGRHSNTAFVLAANSNRSNLLEEIAIHLPRIAQYFYASVPTADSSAYILSQTKRVSYAFMCIDSSGVLERSAPLDPETRLILDEIVKDNPFIHLKKPYAEQIFRRLKKV